MTTVLGYDVEPTFKPTDKKMVPDTVAYWLTGKRGAKYGLVRNHQYPWIMHVINSHSNICSLKGYYQFTDATGEVEPINSRRGIMMCSANTMQAMIRCAEEQK